MNYKIVLLITLIAIGVMATGVSAIVFDENAPIGETKIVSGGEVVGMISFDGNYHADKVTYVLLESGNWISLHSRVGNYVVGAYAAPGIVSRIKFGHNYHLHFCRNFEGWELVKVEEVTGLG